MKIRKRQAAQRLADALCKDIFTYAPAQQFIDSGASELPPELSTSISEARGLFRARVAPEHFVVLEDALQAAGLGAGARDPAAKSWTIMPPAEAARSTGPHWGTIALLFAVVLGAAAALLR